MRTIGEILEDLRKAKNEEDSLTRLAADAEAAMHEKWHEVFRLRQEFVAALKPLLSGTVYTPEQAKDNLRYLEICKELGIREEDI